MNFPDGLFPAGWEVGGYVCLVAGLGLAALRAPWHRLLDGARSNLWLGSIVLVALVWSLKAGVQPGLAFHLLGAMALTLMFGPWLAVLALSAVAVMVTLNGAGGWAALGLNIVLGVFVPVTVSYAVYAWADRRLPNHFFVFIFVIAFLGAAGSVLVTGVMATLALWLAGAYSGEHLLANFLPYHLLLAFSEAMLTGMITTLFVVYKPQWVCTFDDTRYLLNK